MPRFRDISGQRFGELTAVRINGKDPTGKTRWECLCDCGNKSYPTMLNLVNGVSKSCGHLRNESRTRSDLTGMKFGLLTALRTDGQMHWVCKCECGSESRVATTHLLRAHTRSCGCLAKKMTPTSSDLNKRMRVLSTRTWADVVKREAGFACEFCGDRSNLHAHHIAPWSLFIEGRMWSDNGLCICARCHRSLHSRGREIGSDVLAFEEMMIDRCRKYLTEENCNGK